MSEKSMSKDTRKNVILLHIAVMCFSCSGVIGQYVQVPAVQVAMGRVNFYWQYRWCVKTSWHWIRRKITDLWFWQVLWWQSTGLVSFNRSRHRLWQSGPLHFQLSHCFWHFWNLYYSMRRYAVRIFWMLWSFWWEYWSRFRNFQWRIKWRLEFSGECWQVLLMQ